MFRRRRPSTTTPTDSATPTQPTVAIIDDRNFLSSTAGALSVVDFWAPWCGPCRQFAPVFEDVAEAFGDRLRFWRCNVDHSPDLAAMLQIMSIPTIVMFGLDGSEISRIVGVPRRAEFERIITGLAARSEARRDP